MQSQPLTTTRPELRRGATRASVWAAFMCAWGAALAWQRPACAQSEPAAAEPNEPVLLETRTQPRTSLEVERAPGVFVGLGGYAGLSVLAKSDEKQGHMIAGGLGRLRIGYFQLGGTLEVSDLAHERWQSIGGFIGGVIPYKNWVDVELALSGGVRNYKNPLERYGPGGYNLKTPTLGLRAGISDRSSRARMAVRLGGELLVSFDLRRQHAEWAYTYTDLNDQLQTVRGRTPVGGLTVGLALNATFEVSAH